jgi:hypothetical protein
MVGEAIVCRGLDSHCLKELDVVVLVRWGARIKAFLFKRPRRGLLFTVTMLVGVMKDRRKKLVLSKGFMRSCIALPNHVVAAE